MKNNKDYFLSLKKSTTFAYIVSLLLSGVAVFWYAHIYELTPGFVLMSFAMKFFFLCFLFFISVFFLIFSFFPTKKSS